MIPDPFMAWGMPGGGELIIVFVIILLLFGAKRLPELARSLGQAKKEFTKATREVGDEIEKIKEPPAPKPPSENPPRNNPPPAG